MRRQALPAPSRTEIDRTAPRASGRDTTTRELPLHRSSRFVAGGLPGSVRELVSSVRTTSSWLPCTRKDNHQGHQGERRGHSRGAPNADSHEAGCRASDPRSSSSAPPRGTVRPGLRFASSRPGLTATPRVNKQGQSWLPSTGTPTPSSPRCAQRGTTGSSARGGVTRPQGRHTKRGGGVERNGVAGNPRACLKSVSSGSPSKSSWEMSAFTKSVGIGSTESCTQPHRRPADPRRCSAGRDPRQMSPHPVF